MRNAPWIKLHLIGALAINNRSSLPQALTHKPRSSDCAEELIRSEIGTIGVANADKDHGIIDLELDC
jgi:hypothetical protein